MKNSSKKKEKEKELFTDSHRGRKKWGMQIASYDYVNVTGLVSNEVSNWWAKKDRSKRKKKMEKEKKKSITKWTCYEQLFDVTCFKEKLLMCIYESQKKREALLSLFFLIIF